MLKINQQTVRNMIDRGEMGAVRVGQMRVRVRQSQLDAFLAAGEMTHEPAGSAAAGLDKDAWRGVRRQQARWRPPSTAGSGSPLSRHCPLLANAARGL